MKATQDKLEAVENDLIAERYVDIDDVTRSAPYEETGTYDTIEDNGYQSLNNESRNSGYLKPIDRQGQAVDYMSFDSNADSYVNANYLNDNKPDSTDILSQKHDYVNAENIRE